MDVRLKVLVGKNAGHELNVDGPKFFIGRAEDCQLRPRSDLISRHHCVLLIEEGVLVVRDFGSKNGTHVNGERVSGECELKVGDRLTIGPLEFEVSIAAGVATKRRSKVESIKEAAARTAEGSSDDLDVSQWLGPGEAKAGTSETRVVNTVRETTEIDLRPEKLSAPSEPQPASEADAVTEERPTKKKGRKKEPGKLPVAAPQAAGDSRQAATDVLNKFFKRR